MCNKEIKILAYLCLIKFYNTIYWHYIEIIITGLYRNARTQWMNELYPNTCLLYRQVGGWIHGGQVNRQICRYSSYIYRVSFLLQIV